MTTKPNEFAAGRESDHDGARDDDTLGYADAIAELERILDELADDDVDVDVLSSKVARASVLIRLCRGRIRSAELQVNEIVADLDAVEPAETDAPTEPSTP